MAFIKKNIIWLISLVVLGAMTITLGINLNVKSNGFSHTPFIANNTISRSLNTSFMVSDQRCAVVMYSVTITLNPTALAANAGSVILESSPNNSTWTGIDTASASFGPLAIATLVTIPFTIKGTVPRNTWLRIRTQTDVGAAPVFRLYPGLELQFN